jgi:hypothetical protein
MNGELFAISAKNIVIKILQNWGIFIVIGFWLLCKEVM